MGEAVIGWSVIRVPCTVPVTSATTFPLGSATLTLKMPLRYFHPLPEWPVG